MSNQYRDDGPRLDRGLPGEGLDPTDVKVPPCRERNSRPLEIAIATADGDHLFVEAAYTRRVPDDSGRTV
jgi:hypothetical protein